MVWARALIQAQGAVSAKVLCWERPTMVISLPGLLMNTVPVSEEKQGSHRTV